METVAEQWRAIPEVFGYEASNLGRIRSIDRVVFSIRNGKSCPMRQRGRVLVPCNNRGYSAVSVQNNLSPQFVHALVMKAFIGERPEGYEIDHINNNRKDNRLSNLEYVTHAENVHRAYKTGRIKRPEGRKFLDADAVRKIRELKGSAKTETLAKQFGVGAGHIREVARRHKWKHVD